MLTIGIDIGTTSVCGALYDAEKEKVIEAKSIEHHALLESGDVFSYKMDAKKLVFLSGQIYRELLKKAPEKPVGICVTGQMHGVVYVDRNGEIISPLYTWMDMRGNQARTKKQSYAQYYTALTGYPLRSGYGVVTHLYNMYNGLVPENIEKLCTIMDVFTMYLCGKKTPVTDSSNAASIGLFDMKAGGFDLHALAQLKQDLAESGKKEEAVRAMLPERFPEVKETGSVLGYTKEGLLVYNSIGDNQAGTYWAIRRREDEVLLNIGTSGQISVLTDFLTEEVPMGLELRPYVDDKYLFVGAMLNGGNVYHKLESFFEEVLALFGDAPKTELYAKMNEILAENPPEENGMQAETCFLGTRVDPDKKGKITGITLSNFNVPSLLNAFAEGILKEGYGLYLQIPDFLREKHQEIVVAGNLLRRSEAFRMRAERRFGLRIKETEAAEEAAAGAARLVSDQLKRK